MAAPDADRIMGNTDDDILIAGSIIYDRIPSLLNLVMLVWTRTDLTYSERINTLSDKSAPVVLNQTTVQRDGSADVLTGSVGDDWFWFNLNEDGDRVTDLHDEAFAGDLDWLLLEI